MKSMNWISGTGRRPYRAIPIAVPMIPPSLSGVSNTRSGNSSISPSVHRNTPPFRPMSSPRRTTRSSRRISSRSALFTACTIVIAGISGLPPHPLRVRVVAFLRAAHDPREPRVLEEGGELGLGFSLFAVLRPLRGRPLQLREGVLDVPPAGRDARELVPGARPPRVELRRAAVRLLRRLDVPHVHEVEREGHPGLRVLRVGLHRPPVERDRSVDVALEGVALGRGGGVAPRGRHRLADLVPDRLLEVRLELLRPDPEAGEVPLVDRDRIVPPPRLDLLLVPVPGGVVGRRVGPEPVRHALDEGRSAARARPPDRVPRGAVHREGVVPIDPHAVEPIREGLLRDRLRGGLLRDREGDRPLVVVAQEHGRRAEHAREVHPRVEVRRRRASVPEVREGDEAVPADLRGPRGPHRERDLRPDAARDRHEVPAAVDVVAGHLPPVDRVRGVPHELVHEVEEGHPAGEGGARLPVLREDPVVRLEREGGCDDRRLLADGRAVEPDPPLPLEGEHAVVEDPLHEHEAVQPDRVGGREPRVDVGIRRAVLADHSQQVAHGPPLPLGTGTARGIASGSARKNRMRGFKGYALVLSRVSRNRSALGGKGLSWVSNASLGFYTVWAAHLGRRYGILRALSLRGNGATVKELSRELGLFEPALQVWCEAAHSLGLLARKGARYTLSSKMRTLFVDEHDADFIGGAVSHLALPRPDFGAFDGVFRGGT